MAPHSPAAEPAKRLHNKTTQLHHHHHRDRQMLKIIIIQIFTNIFFSLPYTGYSIYQVQKLTQGNTEVEQLLLRLFLYLFYFNHATPFYTNTLTSKIFRSELVKLFLKLKHRLNL
ncbi:unnamed protein product, partial [Didymodactylos carnosus]